VPVLAHVGWKVLETGEGYAKAILPLNYESTNQHGTHQAALMVLAGDYTGGIALATLLRGVPIIGVHPQRSDNGAALWLVSVDITYKTPSASALVIASRFAPDEFARIRRRYFQGKQCLESVRVVSESEGIEVAAATFSYFLKQSACLRPQSPQARMNILFSHRVKASARLNRKLLSSIRQLMGNVDSVLWVDLVAKSVIDRTSGFAEVENFVSGMEKLGEPFIFGLEDAAVYFSTLGLEVASRAPSNVYRPGLTDPVFRLYEFFLLRARR
jgi:hypothetical protein